MNNTITPFEMSKAIKAEGFHSVDLFPDGREEFELGRFVVSLPPHPIAAKDFEIKIAQIKNAMVERLEGGVMKYEI